MQELISLIREEREKANLTTRKLAELSGVSQSYLSQLENGRRKKPPSPEIIKKLSNALNYDYYQMMRLAGYMDLKTLEEQKPNWPEEIRVTSLVKNASDDFIKNILEKELAELEERLEINNGIFKEDSLNLNSIDESNDTEIDDSDSEAVYLEGLKQLIVEDSKMATELRSALNSNIQDFHRQYFYSNYKKLMSAEHYLQLLRNHFQQTEERVAEKTGLSIEEYKNLENHFELDNAPFTELEVAFGIENLKNWFILETGLLPTNEIGNLLRHGHPNTESTLNPDFYEICFTEAATEEIEVLIGQEKEKVIKHYSREEVQRKFFSIDHLLNRKEEVTFNNRILSEKEKQKALSILEILFESDEK